MSAGYGRGYYGKEQLARPPRRRGSGWVKIALVVGAGAVIWLLWPRKAAALVPGRDGAAPGPLPPPSLPPAQEGPLALAQEGQLAQASAPPPSPALPAPVGQVAPTQVAPVAPVVPLRSLAAPVHLPGLPAPSEPARGLASAREYEDAVVASARQLQDSGAKVVLAPHFAHLTPRLRS